LGSTLLLIEKATRDPLYLWVITISHQYGGGGSSSGAISKDGRAAPD
jgi:hypothetical protein